MGSVIDLPVRKAEMVLDIVGRKMERKFKTTVVNVSLLFSVILVLLLMGETYLRIQHDKFTAQYKHKDLCYTESSNPDLIYTSIPNKCDTNSNGYRDYEYCYEKKKDTFRIVVIGDSVATGRGVEVEESFGNLLEKELNNLMDRKRFEVIILGESGYSTSQELILLENEAFNYNPNLIIWSYVLNDPAHPIYHNANGKLGRYFF